MRKAEAIASARPDNACDLPSIIERRGTALKVSELGEYLEIGRTGAYELLKRGELPYYRIGGAIRLDPGVVAAWLRSRAISNLEKSAA